MATCIRAIVAFDEDRGIGFENTIPWKIPEDMKRFRTATMGDAVLMGRLTYESLPEAYRPLPGRFNVVATRNNDFPLPEEVLRVSDPVQWLEQGTPGVEGDLWICGGQQLYTLCLPWCDELLVTRVKGTFSADTQFPVFEELFDCVEQEVKEGYTFETYRKREAMVSVAG